MRAAGNAYMRSLPSIGVMPVYGERVIMRVKQLEEAINEFERTGSYNHPS